MTALQCARLLAVATPCFGIVLGLIPLASVRAQPGWKPEKNVELIVPSAAGGGLDRTARTVHKIWQDNKLIASPVAVVNKPGGSGTISYTYLNQFAGDGHYISISSPTLLTNHILGVSRLGHADFTPLAQLSSEYLMLMIRTDSPLKTSRDVLDRLRQDPSALSIAIGSIPGGANHIGIARVLKAAGVDVRKLKTVVFKSGTESVTALMGGHIDLSANAPEQVLRHLEGGKIRAIAIGSPRRLPGVLADIPTWKESGIDIVTDTWRGIIGPKGLSAAQISFWDGALARLVDNREWQTEVEKQHWLNNYHNSLRSRQFLDAEYQALKTALTELGLAK